jgi:tetratricopeptide (TPR) repeat protein
MRRFEEAVRTYEDALKRWPEYLPLLVNLGETYQKLGEHEKAEKTFADALAIDPDFEDIYISQGCLFLETARYASAIESFDQSLAIDPQNCLTLLNKAEALNCLKRHAEALAILDLVQQYSGGSCEDADALVQRYVALHGLGEHLRARETAQRILAIDASNSFALQKLKTC